MIRVQNISKYYKEAFKTKTQVLENLSFNINQGEITGFLGANGAGKTTFIKILMQLIKPSEGLIEFDHNIFKGNIFKYISFLPERPYYYQNLTGMDFLIYCSKLYQVELTKLHEVINEWAKELKIDHALHRPLKGYSKGMLQRVGLLSGLINGPKFFVLDEPLSGLDPYGRYEFKKVFARLREEGCSLFFSSHILPDVQEIADRIIFIDQGKLKYDGTITDLLHKHDVSYEISYIADETSEKVVVINEEEKDDFIKNLILSGAIIKKVELQSSSLEQTLYNHENLV